MVRPAGRSAIAVACAVIAAFAWAAPRTFVSGAGNDANPCSLGAPCRSFSAAINAADAGGEVIALDTAGYGPFAINKSISIISPPGVVAAISNGVPVPGVFGSLAAVDINAGASDRILLRGLNVNIVGGDIAGVVIRSAGIVHIENATLTGSSSTSGGAHGILVQPASKVELFVKDSVVRSFVVGFKMNANLPSGVVAAVDRVRVEGSHFGIIAVNNVHAVMRDVVAAGNGQGFYATTTDLGLGAASLVLERCTASHNTNQGVEADPGSVFLAANITISNCAITHNGIGVLGGTLAPPAGARVHSRQNNTIRDNGTNVSGDIDVVTGL